MREVTPKDFFSDAPPERVIGTECEYNVQGLSNDATMSLLSPTALYNAGLTMASDTLGGVRAYDTNGYTGNGSRIYVDLDHIEYATPESLGPVEAATTEAAGVGVIDSLLASAKLPHKGVYKRAGTAKPGSSGTFSSGYHENYAIPEELWAKQSNLLQQILPLHLVTRMWAGAGMMLSNEYVFSQKAWGIGDRSTVYSKRENSVGEGEKSMANIRDTTNVVTQDAAMGDLIEERLPWLRLEVRFADPHISPEHTYLCLAVGSLVLRLVEHSEKLNIGVIRMMQAKGGGSDARQIAADLAMTATIGDPSFRFTALDAQEELLHQAEELNMQIDVPPSEQHALLQWRSVIDGLRQSRPQSAEYHPDALRYTGFAAKHVLLHQVEDRIKDEEYPQMALFAADLAWSRVIQPGVGQEWWQTHEAGDGYVAENLDAAVYLRQAPQATRARQRSDYIRSINPQTKTGVIDWRSWAGKKHLNPYGMPSPEIKDPRRPRLVTRMLKGLT